MKKIIIACALFISMHNLSHASQDYTLRTIWYYTETLDKAGTKILKRPVTYDQAAFPQRNDRESIHVYATNLVIYDDNRHVETHNIPLSNFQGKGFLKLADGRTVRFTESTEQNGVIIYDMPKIEKESNCIIS